MIPLGGSPGDFLALLRTIPGLFAVMTPDFVVVEASDAYLQASHISRSDLLGRTLFDAFFADAKDPALVEFGASLRASLLQALETKAPHTMAVNRYDVLAPESEGGGLVEHYWAPLNLPVLNASGDVIYLIHRVEEVSEQRLVQKRIEKLGEDARRQAHVFDSVLSSTADFNYIFDRQGRFSYINRALLTLLGITFEQAVGKNFHDLNYPLELATKLQAQIEQVFVTGKQLKDETPFTNPEGMWGYYEYIFVPIFDSEGRVEAVAGSTRDISEHKRAQAALKASDDRLAELNRDLEKQVMARTEQLRQKDQELFQAQKLEAIGRLSGGVAHDFNNLITGIIGITEDIRDQLGPESPHRADLDEVIKAGQKASALTRQLLAFGRKQISAQKILNWNSVIVDMNRMFERLLGEDVEVVTSLDPRLGNVKGDQSHLEQVVVNLILNARDAISGSGKIYLTTANVDLDGDYMQRHFNILPGPYVCLTIADTGTGIPSDVLDHIFEPFFTTKGQGKGTGLGLATVYGIIKQNNGDISVYSELGKGTTFKIYLPRVSEIAGLESRQAALPGSPTGSEKILVVEDEDIVRRVAVKALMKRGYHVFEAKNGEEALGVLQGLDGPLDLLITDVVMPGMNGRLVAQRMSEKQPGLRVLFMSGHAQDVMFERGIIEPGVAFIEKSFSADAFCRKVREVLDATLKNEIGSTPL